MVDGSSLVTQVVVRTKSNYWDLSTLQSKGFFLYSIEWVELN